MVEIKLTISDKLYHQAQRLAALREQEVEQVMSEYLEQLLIVNDSLPKNKDREREKRAFLNLHPQLKQDFPGQHVAIHEGQLVDHDLDRLALSKRINQKYPDRFVLIRPVQDQPEIEYRFRSIITTLVSAKCGWTERL